MTTAADHTRTCTRRRSGTSGNMLVRGGDTSGLHGNLINQSRDTGEDLLTEKVK